uniref:Integrase catalytic domain-containing protein n=1 Tax=Strongyloides venezuelensis TaxID=75913 RepID=A0A0K0EVA9_STRVS
MELLFSIEDQEYELIYKRGYENHTADFLSRVNVNFSIKRFNDVKSERVNKIFNQPILNKMKTLPSMEEWFNTFGYPKYLYSNNAKVLHRQQLIEWLQLNDIISIYGASYEHHNSEIERAFRTVRAIYKKLPIKSKDVQKNLNKVAHIINTAEHKYLQCSPNTLVFRYNPRLRAENLMNLKLDNDSQGEKFMDLQYVLKECKDRSSYPVNSKFNKAQEDYYHGDKLHPRTEKGKILYKDNGVTKIQPDGTNDKRQCN